MAASLNKVLIIGNLGQDPEPRVGLGPCRLSVATSESWRDKTTGERREQTTWHRIIIFEKRAADFAEKYLSKGDKVWIEGKLMNRSWEDDKGIKRYATEIVLSGFNCALTSLEGSKGGGGFQKSDSLEDYGLPDNRPSNANADVQAPIGAGDNDWTRDGDDEIPF